MQISFKGCCTLARHGRLGGGWASRSRWKWCQLNTGKTCSVFPSNLKPREIFFVEKFGEVWFTWRTNTSRMYRSGRTWLFCCQSHPPSPYYLQTLLVNEVILLFVSAGNDLLSYCATLSLCLWYPTSNMMHLSWQYIQTQHIFHCYNYKALIVCVEVWVIYIYLSIFFFLSFRWDMEI